MEWSTYFEADVKRGEVGDAALDALAERLAEWSVAVSGGDRHIGARFCVRANDISRALAVGLERFEDALGKIIGRNFRITEAGAQEWERFSDEIERSNKLELMGVAEVALMLGVSKQRVSELARLSHFPRPMYELAAGPVWVKAAIERFVERWERRPGRPRSKARV